MEGKSYKKIAGLKITEYSKVCPVLTESKFLADCVSLEPKSNVLDMGTGNGCIALLLAKQGFCVTGVDIDQEAIENARENAKNNSLNINLFKSDLFSEVKDKYDIIIFNLPTFAGNMRVYKFILLLSRIFPTWCRNYLSLLHEFSPVRRRVFKNRETLVIKFLSGCRGHLNPNGKIFMCASEDDLDDIITPYCRDYFLKISRTRIEEVPIKRYIAKIAL